MSHHITEEQLRNLSIESLEILYEDAYSRVQSHMLGGNSVNDYVVQQSDLMKKITNERLRRNEK